MPAMTLLLVYLFGKKSPGSSAPRRFLALLGSVLLSFLGLLLASLAARFVDVRSAGWGQRQSAAAVIVAALVSSPSVHDTLVEAMVMATGRRPLPIVI